ncbi:type III pantothenate kinase [Flavobacterium agricola]|uniref:Type III pantothenate kinase n=1 Tax=Flavobacterium agricola TaxID=2870839 RepID=A0ABY6LYE8_9FLAO|nr:type III pantothenate kinase [Flavobacterium agricola]UYW01316.1 type III pantothenate kinase [Flavobacterium agricola]
MLLVIDVGNTRVKLFVYEDNELISQQALLHDNFYENFLIFFKQNATISHVILSSVGNLDLKVIEFLKKHTAFTQVTYQSALPFVNDYATPATLGVDRIVLAAGAVLDYPNQNRLVIDLGTCITYDFITADNHYKGGAISPGLQMRYQALAHFTAKLPLLSFEEPDYLIGNTTNQSIQSGVFNGFVNEINGFIADYEKHFTNLAVILTGGDCEVLSKKIKSNIFVTPNFLTDSLKKLHDYIATTQ